MTTTKVGAVGDVGDRKQHVDLGRKLGQRRRLLEQVGPGPAYLPFCGDGDIAAEMYPDRDLWAADLDKARVATFQERFPDAQAVAADCDGWPFRDRDTPAFTVGDFDSYSYPYDSFRAWWESTTRTDPCLVLFTDGQRQAVKRKKPWRDPWGERHQPSSSFRKIYNSYWAQVAQPWIEEVAQAAGLTVAASDKYQRGDMLHWGVILTADGAASGEPEDQVLGALREAAVSGNVMAAERYLDIRRPPAEADRLNTLFEEAGW